MRITFDFSMYSKSHQGLDSWDVGSKKPWMSAQITITRKFSITISGKNMIFNDKVKIKQYQYINPVLQKVLKPKVQPKEANYTCENTENKQSNGNSFYDATEDP